ncbi:MAG: hypothetical protein DHS80DRAFT_31424 [Piptocephalis tieghemiana]|nr:MAG: hypothetical protein DHS80DRAFT_31424 [Piptocephalis tieghemiana]
MHPGLSCYLLVLLSIAPALIVGDIEAITQLPAPGLHDSASSQVSHAHENRPGYEGRSTPPPILHSYSSHTRSTPSPPEFYEEDEPSLTPTYPGRAEDMLDLMKLANMAYHHLAGENIASDLAKFRGIPERELTQSCSALTDEKGYENLQRTHEDGPVILHLLCNAVDHKLSSEDQFYLIAWANQLLANAAIHHFKLLAPFKERSVKHRKRFYHLLSLSNLYLDHYSISSLPLAFLPRRVKMVHKEMKRTSNELASDNWQSYMKPHRKLISLLEEKGQIRPTRSKSAPMVSNILSVLDVLSPQDRLSTMFLRWNKVLDSIQLISPFLLSQLNYAYPGLLGLKERSNLKEKQLKKIVAQKKKELHRMIEQARMKSRRYSGGRDGGSQLSKGELDLLEDQLLILSLPLLDGLSILLGMYKDLQDSRNSSYRTSPARTIPLGTEARVVDQVMTTLSLDTLAVRHPHVSDPRDPMYEELRSKDLKRLGLSEEGTSPWVLIMHKRIEMHAILLWSTIWPEHALQKSVLSRVNNYFQGSIRPVYHGHPVITLVVQFALSLMRLGYEDIVWLQHTSWMQQGLGYVDLLRSHPTDKVAQWAARFFDHLFPNFKPVLDRLIHHPNGNDKNFYLSAECKQLEDRLKDKATRAYMLMSKLVKDGKEFRLTVEGWGMPKLEDTPWMSTMLAKKSYNWNGADERVKENRANYFFLELSGFPL